MGPRLLRFRTALDVSVLLTLSVGALAATMSLSSASRGATGALAVVFSPWTDAGTALTRAVEAGGRVVRFGAVPFVAIASPDDDGFVARAYAAGAWLVLDPKFLAGCFSSPEKNP